MNRRTFVGVALGAIAGLLGWKAKGYTVGVDMAKGESTLTSLWMVAGKTWKVCGLLYSGRPTGMLELWIGQHCISHREFPADVVAQTLDQARVLAEREEKDAVVFDAIWPANHPSWYLFQSIGDSRVKQLIHRFAWALGERIREHGMSTRVDMLLDVAMQDPFGALVVGRMAITHGWKMECPYEVKRPDGEYRTQLIDAEHRKRIMTQIAQALEKKR